MISLSSPLSALVFSSFPKREVLDSHDLFFFENFAESPAYEEWELIFYGVGLSDCSQECLWGQGLPPYGNTDEGVGAKCQFRAILPTIAHVRNRMT